MRSAEQTCLQTAYAALSLTHFLLAMTDVIASDAHVVVVVSLVILFRFGSLNDERSFF